MSREIDMPGTAPDFELRTLDDLPVKLSLITPLWPVLLLFFRVRGEACELMMPMLREFEIAYNGADLEILAISQESLHETKNYMASLGWRGRVLVDHPPYAVSASYQIKELPAAVLVGPEMEILASAEGADEAGMNRVSQAVADLASWTYAPVVSSQPVGVEAVPTREG